MSDLFLAHESFGLLICRNTSAGSSNPDSPEPPSSEAICELWPKDQGPPPAELVALAHLFVASPDLLAGLKDVFAIIDEGFLVRDTSQDGDPLWSLNALRYVTRLKAAHDALAKAGG